MARTAKPWYRAERDDWVIYRDGRKVVLAKGRGNKAKALKAFHKLMSEDRKATPTTPETTVGDVVDLFLEYVEREKATLTFQWYHRHVTSFCQHVGNSTPAATVRPFHVTRWLDSHEWGTSTRHGAITAVKRAFEWGRRQGLLTVNTLADMERPGIAARTKIVTPEQALRDHRCHP